LSKFEYLRLADAVAAEIASGSFKPGDRLPPQRSFAYERKIAVSTASRVYTELLRRGLVVGEVGRGTFISGETKPAINVPNEPRGARIDLEFNYPTMPTQSTLIAKSLEGLDKPDALDAAERTIIERHCEVGERILAAAPAMAPVARLVGASHERYDGTGYPDRRSGPEIPRGASIIAVCDAFHAMTSIRPYSCGVDTHAAITELRSKAGTQFDPNVVEAFCAEFGAGHLSLKGRPRATTGQEGA